YTNKDSFDINMRFKEVLSLGMVSSEINQVARYIADRLCKESLPKAFIDEKEIEYGAKFKETVDQALKNSYSFVQLVSRETFFQIGAMNWCLYEYNKYKEFLSGPHTQNAYYYNHTLNNNFFFFVIGSTLDEVKPPILIPEYEDWFDEITVRQHARFHYSQNAAGNQNTPGGNKAASDFHVFRDNITCLATAIIQSKKKLIDDIP
ncbi:MAG: hypothetical protein P4L51_20090, partial [Puia sp.]|nr:hypothetical protein [Puia sp.]